MRVHGDVNFRQRLLQGDLSSIALILGLAILSHVTFYAPALFSDDWASTIQLFVSEQSPWFDFASRRPLELTTRLLLFRGFGLNIFAYYLVLIGLGIGAAVQLYYLLRRIVPQEPIIALLTASLVVVYPADYSNMWLTMLHIRVALCLTLLYAWMLLDYADGRHWATLVFALLCIVVSLGMYEAQLGLALAWCVLLAGFARQATWRRWLGLLSPLGVGAAFAIWRVTSLNVRGVSDPLAGQMDLAPGVLLQRLVLGSKVLIWAWTEPVRQVMGLKSTLLAALVIILALLAAGVAGLLIARYRRNVENTDTAMQRRIPQIRQVTVLLIAAILLAIAGYFPVITVGWPNLAMVGSRINLFAIPGASLAIVSGLALGAWLVSRNQRQAHYILVGAVTPLLFIGIFTQASVQYEARRAWSEQKQIWQQLFTLAPDFVDGTTIYFVLHGYEDRMKFVTWQRPPLSAQWEVNSALKVLYDKQDIAGDMMVTGIPRRLPENWITFDRQGITSLYSGSVTGYDKAVFFAFDAASGRLRLVKDLSAELALPWQIRTYAPEKRILDEPARPFPWRSLVGMAHQDEHQGASQVSIELHSPQKVVVYARSRF